GGLLAGATEGQGKSPEDLMTFASRLEDEYAEAGRRASAHAVGALRRRLGEWLGNDRIPWEDVGPDFERKFASWLATRGIAQSTQSFYCKRLRTLLLRASAAGLLP
ncbi:MAG: phage integrase SAM-like domain-containing protein, partial [Muribaculaceae bacterium]|nr:phage integrase SAM-like domain-containing protein [Muribaculaceae bacterium]